MTQLLHSQVLYVFGMDTACGAWAGAMRQLPSHNTVLALPIRILAWALSVQLWAC